MRKSSAFPSTTPNSDHGSGLEAESAIENFPETFLRAGVPSCKVRTSSPIASTISQTSSKPEGFHNFSSLRVEPFKVNGIIDTNAGVCSTRKEVHRGPRMG